MMCLARALLGPLCSDCVMELNASDDRGIEVVRSKIKAFATMRCVLPEGRHRMVIMDEADR